MNDRLPTVSGLRAAHPRTCPCGTVFTARKASARYCSNDCRLRFTRYGRSYGQYEARKLGWTKT
jgi:hypothetical protein